MKGDKGKDTEKSEDKSEFMFSKTNSFNQDWNWETIHDKVIGAARAIQVVEENEKQSVESDDKVFKKTMKTVNVANARSKRNQEGGEYSRDGYNGRGSGYVSREGKGKTECKGCGNAHDNKDDECPAIDNECGFCEMIGHFERCCAKKRQAREQARKETAQEQRNSHHKKHNIEDEEEEEEDEEIVQKSPEKKQKQQNFSKPRNVNFARAFHADEYDTREEWLAEEPYRYERRPRWYEQNDS